MTRCMRQVGSCVRNVCCFPKAPLRRNAVQLLQDGTVRREDLFITGKLNNPYHHREHVRPHLEKTLKVGPPPVTRAARC